MRISGPKTSLSLMKNVRCQLSPFSVSLKNSETRARTKFVQREKPSHEMENETIMILFERQKEQILVDFVAEIQKQEFQADSDRRSVQELNGSSNLSEEKLVMLLQEMNNFDEINNFFMNNFQNKIGIFVKIKLKVLMRWKN